MRSRDRGSLTGWRLARRSLAHRRWQSVLVVVVSALISATAVFAAGYQRQVQQAVVDATFSVDGGGNAWSLTGAPLLNGQPGPVLPDLIPPGLKPLTQPPLIGRSAVVAWAPTATTLPEISGSLQWREDICAHLALVQGGCPASADQVAVSTADALTFRVKTGDQLELVTTTLDRPPPVLTVSGVYRPTDPDDPYWFGRPPTGFSRFPDNGSPQSNPLIAVPELFQGAYADTLDLRLDHAAVHTGDLGALTGYDRTLHEAAARRAQLSTDVPDSLARIGQERDRAVAGLTLSLVQLAVLIGVVLALLASVQLAAQRAELGLGRLRGEPAAQLRRQVAARWAAVITVGWLVGWLPGLGLLAVVAAMLPGRRSLLLGPAVAVVPLAALLVMVAAIAFPARALLAQPVISLLRSAPAAVRETGGRALLVDAVLLVLAVTGLLVAIQVGTTSVLGLLVPSLLALGLSVVLFRLLVRLAARRARSLAQRGTRPGSLLTAALTVRLRGLRLLLVGTTVAAAFAVFAVQLYAIGSSVRQYDAEVRTGAAVVLEVDGDLAAVRRTLTGLDPRHATPAATMTVVAVTRRTDDRALRGMFVEPAGFAAVAYGTDRATDPATWLRLTAPVVDPITFTGESLTVRIGRHRRVGRTDQAGVAGTPTRTGRRADLAIDYLSADGIRRSSTLGPAQLAASNGERLRGPVVCRDGCRLLQVVGRPDGPMAGTLPLSALTVEHDGLARPVDLGPAERWQHLPSANPDDRLDLRAEGGGVVLDVSSNGGEFGIQHAWAPLTLPVLVAEDARVETAPTLAAPDGSPVAIEPVARSVDAVPGSRRAVAVGDLESVLRAGYARAAPSTAVQIWVSAAGAGRLDQLRQALTEAGVTVTSTRTAADAAAVNRGTASALSAQIGPGLALLAGVFAGLGVALTMSAQRSVLGRDLAALRLAGVADRTVRRAAAVTYLRPGLLAVLAGTVAGTLGCVLVVDGLPMLADPLPAIHADLRLRLPALAGSVVLAAAVLTGVVLLGVRRLDRGSGPDGLGGQS